MGVTRCQWIDGSCKCYSEVLIGKSYCLIHYKQAYLLLPEAIADYIIEKELLAEFTNSEHTNNQP